MHILVTGASGFVGRALVEHLSSRPGHQVSAALRDPARLQAAPAGVTLRKSGDLAPDTDWTDALSPQVDAIVHCAARVHVMNETSADPLAEFRRVNVAGTLNLARQAQAAGVKRFVFVSSIKVNGEQTPPGRPFTADDTPAPMDPYGVSKLEAEQALLELARQTGMEVVVVRPVLVHGPGVKANFLSMMRWLDKGVPLPLGGITGNRRSIVALDNLVDLIDVCLTHPNAAGQVFLASDGEDLSTTALLRRVARALGKHPLLLPVPAPLLAAAARILGKPAIAQRLCGSLQVDIGKNRQLLNWTPPVGVDEALRKTVAAYRNAG
ncbi:UDP-glucose 4-epimerase family protein [Herbaspirillum robiniae]|uniref:SDR family oxidoreductase n=1 Tax=Herbaspirillum robiniae TaxID=2014887 RepID=A0ABX2M4J7_9BURK|nr:SDR family oxidoreductase [Herbaspirillum robiniae]NUU03177.1 SDR family oxidoreductase [Herbaspirillum robiniae]